MIDDKLEFYSNLLLKRREEGRKYARERRYKMKEEKVNEIMKEIIEVWKERYDDKTINPDTVELVRQAISQSPHDDGIIPTECGKKTYAVPLKDIVLYGVKGYDIARYPIYKGDKK